MRDYVSVAADEILTRLEEIHSKKLAAESNEVAEKPKFTVTSHKHTLLKINGSYKDWSCAECEEVEGQGERWHCAMCLYDICDGCADYYKESIKTDAFLSHKRTTAQVIAGRLYEGLKEDYNIFLDSEAKFKVVFFCHKN